MERDSVAGTLVFILFLLSFSGWAASADRASNWIEQAQHNLLGFKGLNNRRATVPVNRKYLDDAATEQKRRVRKVWRRRRLSKQLTAKKINSSVLRCIRKNNYWCIKNGSKWPGAVGQDSAGHAIFSDPKYAAQAKVSVMRRYYLRCGFHSLKTDRGCLCTSQRL